MESFVLVHVWYLMHPLFFSPGCEKEITNFDKKSHLNQTSSFGVQSVKFLGCLFFFFLFQYCYWWPSYLWISYVVSDPLRYFLLESCIYVMYSQPNEADLVGEFLTNLVSGCPHSMKICISLTHQDTQMECFQRKRFIYQWPVYIKQKKLSSSPYWIQEFLEGFFWMKPDLWPNEMIFHLHLDFLLK